ncbi:hypothetical protein MASR1M31_13670 [Porphyromonadaceae bacterium]
MSKVDTLSILFRFELNVAIKTMIYERKPTPTNKEENKIPAKEIPPKYIMGVRIIKTRRQNPCIIRTFDRI